MSVLSRATRMRIIALPLTTRTPGRDALTYYHFVTARPDKSDQKNLLKRAQTKASEIWAGFGKAEGGWKLKTYQYGERLVDRLDFEELALSGLDPSLGPKITKFGEPEVKVEDDSDAGKEYVPKDRTPIALIHPTFDSAPSPLVHLSSLLDHRKPRHKRGAWTWALIAPLTAPFAIIPIIPNLPFFFCVWRTWSHWRAYRASTYLDSLLERGAIAPEANAQLDEIYARYRAPSIPAPPAPGAEEKPAASPLGAAAPSETAPSAATSKMDMRPLLTREAVPSILALFGLPESSAGDMYRAIEQTRQRSSKAD